MKRIARILVYLSMAVLILANCKNEVNGYEYVKN